MYSRLLRYGKTFGVAAFISVVVLGLVGYYLGLEAALIALLLMILETTLSFDNAVINARVLRRMSRFWQQMFLTIGILIAVFGMRIIFPIVLVAITANLPVDEVLELAFSQPEEYSSYLEAAQPVIAAFGGMFLLLVFLTFFIMENNEHRWIAPIESAFKRLPQRWFVAPLLASALLLVLAAASGPSLFWSVLQAGFIGIGIFVLTHGLVSYIQSRHLATKAAQLTGMGGLAAFLYLEVLDATFSFDGVIGAFAITSSVVLIAAGLGVGAVWVRSMTIYLVRHETLGKYIYLEQGAHHAIGLLALVLLTSLFVHVPEVITGLAGVSIIGLSVASSRRQRAKQHVKEV